MRYDIREEWKKIIEAEGLKFFVIKAEDLFELPESMVEDFNTILHRTNENREAKGKLRSNKYWIVNRDETYADQIKEIIKKNENVKLQD